MHKMAADRGIFLFTFLITIFFGCQGRITYELVKLIVHADGTQREISCAGSNNSATATALDRLVQQTTRIETKLDNMLQLMYVIEDAINKTSHGIETIPGLSTCVRGMQHTSPRQRIQLWDGTQALCDTETDGGGWVIIQRRTKGDVDFFRGWYDYKKGFGTPDTDFWIGNEVIHNLTSQNYRELRIDLVADGRTYFAHYSNFSIGSELSNYKLSISGFSGTADDCLAYHNGMMFSTLDRDNDPHASSCARMSAGAWWYNHCYMSNLNGQWMVNTSTGVKWVIDGKTVRATSEMKLRLS